MLFDVVTPRARTAPDLSMYGQVMNGMAPLNDKYSGADLSLTSTGLATLQYGRLRKGLIKSKNMGTQRLADLRATLDAEITLPLPKLVAIEGYSYGSKNSHSHSIGEWGGVARLVFHDAGVPVIVISPSDLKTFITGSHQAKKPEMVMNLLKRWGLEVPQEDEADATGLAIFAACYDRPGCLQLTAFQQKVIDKIRISTATGCNALDKKSRARRV